MTENEVHEHLYKVELEGVVLDFTEFGEGLLESESVPVEPDEEFELWRIIKAKAMEKLERLHSTIRYELLPVRWTAS